jgi:hypothetical protein
MMLYGATATVNSGLRSAYVSADQRMYMPSKLVPAMTAATIPAVPHATNMPPSLSFGSTTIILEV